MKYKFGYYYLEYKEKYFYWEFIRIYLKMIIVIIATLLKSLGLALYVLCIIIIFIYVLAVIWV